MLPALNEATVLAGILIASLVNGLIPSRAALFLAENVPKPTRETFPSFLSPAVIPASVASNARAASAFVNPASFAINSTNSLLKMFDFFLTNFILKENSYYQMTIAIKVFEPLLTILVTVSFNLYLVLSGIMLSLA